MFKIKPNELFGYDSIVLIDLNNKDELTNKLYLHQFLVTESNEEIEVTQDMMDKLYTLGKVFLEIRDFIKAKTGMICVIGHAFRTVKRNIEIGGAGGSQHMFCEAIDLHFYKSDKDADTGRNYTEHNLPMGKRVFPQLAEQIYDNFKDKLEQVCFYDWGIHFGIKTVRSRKVLRITAINRVVNNIGR